MTILFGHPTGNPNSHNAALAHLEAGRLEAICVPWMPSPKTLRLLSTITPLRNMAARLSRRDFPPLRRAPKIQGRIQEFRRLGLRALRLDGEHLSYEANDWLMRTMRTHVGRSSVTAVHAYEDCSLWQFEEAKRRGKKCIYDMPIGYYPEWIATRELLLDRFSQWLPEGSQTAGNYARPEQKRREMDLADVVLAPSTFVASTIRTHHPEKKIAFAPYGVDTEFWHPRERHNSSDELRFIFAGQISIRKGIPTLIRAWREANLGNAHLTLVGAWQLASSVAKDLPPNVTVLPPVSPEALRDLFWSSDILVFPSFFEGFGLVLLEALSCGLALLASDSTAAPDLGIESCGRIFRTGNESALVEGLRWFDMQRTALPELRSSARNVATIHTWSRYRSLVSAAVDPYV